MKRLLLLALLLPAPARAYSIVWGPLYHGEGTAEAITYREGDFDSFAGVGSAQASVSNAYAISTADLHSIRCQADGYLPETGWTAEGRAEAAIERYFRVVDGSGPVNVEINGTFEGDWGGNGAFALDWSFGVEGVSEIGHTLDNGAWTWAGALNYGQTYVARAHVYAASMESQTLADLRWDAPSAAQPVPEPASLALLGLGVLALGSQMRGEKRKRCAS